MKGGTLGNMERRRGERSSNAILTFASFSPALNVTCYFFSFRSRLVICDPLTSIDSLHLNSQVKKNSLQSHWLTWKASWAALTQSGVLEWVWQVSTLAPSIFLLSADPLETTSSSNKSHWHCPWSGLQRWVWLEAKLPHVSQMRVRYWRESGCYVLACLPARLTNNKKADKIYWRDPTPENFIQPLAL